LLGHLVRLLSDRSGLEWGECVCRYSQRGEVVVNRAETGAHRVDGKVRGLRVAPPTRLPDELVDIASIPTDPALHTHRVGIAPGIDGCLTHDRARLVELGTRRDLREPTVAQPTDATQRPLGDCAEPDRDRALHGTRRQTGARHALVLPVERDRRL